MPERNRHRFFILSALASIPGRHLADCCRLYKPPFYVGLFKVFQSYYPGEIIVGDQKNGATNLNRRPSDALEELMNLERS